MTQDEGLPGAPGAPGAAGAPGSRHVARFHVTVSAPVMVGRIGGRTRAVVPITGGHFRGPEMAGEVMPGGFDWAWLGDDGTAEVEAHYVLRLDDGSFATIVNRGRCLPVPGQPDVFSGRAVPVFETGSQTYAWLNEAQFLCRFTSRMADGFVDLDIYVVE